MVGLAGIEEVGQFNEQLQQCLGVEPTPPILHVLLKSLVALPGDLCPLADVVPDIGQELAIALHQCCQLGVALKLRVLCLHKKYKKPPQPRIELGSPA